MAEIGEGVVPTAEIVEQNKAEVTSAEPIRRETVKRICDGMKGLPRLEEASAYDIPYREKRRTQSDGVFDDETGLYVEASYQTGHKMSRLMHPPGLCIVLSTPPLVDQETMTVSLNKMSEGLRKIYGDSPELDEELERIRTLVGGNNLYDRVKFELFYQEGEEVLNGFSAVTGKGKVPIKFGEPPEKQILDSGGQYLAEAVERVTQQQIEEAERNKQQVQEAIDKVKSEVTPNNKSNLYQYAYHATNRSNIPDISQNGLQPSGENSKEPGTIFFTSWDTGRGIVPKGDKGVLYRFRIKDIPAIAKSLYYDDAEGYYGMSDATNLPISPEHLDFSIDGGETWIPAIPRNIEKAA